jgi:hypothetical protein
MNGGKILLGASQTHKFIETLLTDEENGIKVRG